MLQCFHMQKHAYFYRLNSKHVNKDLLYSRWIHYV